jgi:hypothetical protein
MARDLHLSQTTPTLEQKEPHMKRTLVTLGVFVILMASLTACAGGDINDAAQAFMTAAANGDYATAFDLSGPQLQAEVGSVEGLQAALPGALTDWKFDSISQDNNTATMAGTGTGPDGLAYTVSLYFEKVGEAWKVEGYAADLVP